MNASHASQVAKAPGTASPGEQTPPWWRSLGLKRWHRLTSRVAREFNGLVAVLKISNPVTAQVLQRIEMMEQHIILPIKAAWIAILLRPANYSWIGEQASYLEVDPTYAYCVFWTYIAASILAGILILLLRRIPAALAEGAVFAMTLIDGIFLGVLTVVTGGYNSNLYWIFVALIVRTAVNVPRPTSQLLLNLTLSTCFVVAGVIDSYIAQNLNETDRRVFELYADNPGESLLLRLVLLLLMTLCCYALQVLLERHRQAMEEAREFALREGQLRSAGRLAAQFAHQIKNPLAIINTAAFSLQRGLRENKADAALEQVEMIQEEVQRADLVLTQVMGYAQLSEGHVEKLNVLEELDLAIERVFPPAAHFPFQVHRSYRGSFPPLLMLRRHVSETFINVLQNAREALHTHGGNVYVEAQCREDRSIEVSIRDDGPGIAPEKLGRIFEAYYTTKEKGSGLGLATVKNNVELYGGKVRVESELGKGARFILLFPAKTLMKMAQTNG